MIRLFISYRSLDSAKVDMLVARLASLRDADGTPLYDIWQDKTSIKAGEDWWRSIVHGIINCQVFVFMLSRESAQNLNCRAELSYAVRRNRPILPVVLEGEFTYNPKTGKNDLDYWSLVPDEINQARRQLLFYEGTSFVSQFQASCQHLHGWGLPDIHADLPPDPRHAHDASNDTILLYDQARDAAERLDFQTAERLFLRLVNDKDTLFGSDALAWVALMRDYAKLLRLYERETTRYRLPDEWAKYARRFPLPFTPMFDPRHLGDWVDEQTDSQIMERERLAAEIAERERLVKEKAEADRIAREKAEAERIAAEQAQREKLAKEQAKRDRLAQEQAERERLAKEQAERERLAPLTPSSERSHEVRPHQEERAFTPFPPRSSGGRAGDGGQTEREQAQALPRRRTQKRMLWGLGALMAFAVLAIGALVPAVQNAQAAANIPSVALTPVTRNAAWAPIEREFSGIPFVLVPAGCFMMGEDGEGGQQCFNEPFWISKTEVTQADFARLGGTKARDNTFRGDDKPVENISWFGGAGLRGGHRMPFANRSGVGIRRTRA